MPNSSSPHTNPVLTKEPQPNSTFELGKLFFVAYLVFTYFSWVGVAAAVFVCLTAYVTFTGRYKKVVEPPVGATGLAGKYRLALPTSWVLLWTLVFSMYATFTTWTRFGVGPGLAWLAMSIAVFVTFSTIGRYLIWLQGTQTGSPLGSPPSVSTPGVAGPQTSGPLQGDVASSGPDRALSPPPQASQGSGSLLENGPVDRQGTTLPPQTITMSGVRKAPGTPSGQGPGDPAPRQDVDDVSLADSFALACNNLARAYHSGEMAGFDPVEFMMTWRITDVVRARMVMLVSGVGLPEELALSFPVDGDVSPRLVYEVQMALAEIATLVDLYFRLADGGETWLSGDDGLDLFSVGPKALGLDEGPLDVGAVAVKLDEKVPFFTEMFDAFGDKQLLHAAVVVTVLNKIMSLSAADVEVDGMFEGILTWAALSEVARHRLDPEVEPWPSEELYDSAHSQGGQFEVNEARLVMCGEDFGTLFMMTFEELGDELGLAAINRSHWHVDTWFEVGPDAG